jgi:hypothetical protein
MKDEKQITINEIRIGNWINGNGVDFQVYTETFADIESSYGVFKPIVLTEEWMKRYGFYKMKTYAKKRAGVSSLGWFKENDFFFIIKKFEFDEDDDNVFKVTFHYGNTNLAISHVHTLQNLYYSLTFEELELTPKNK